jgi:RNA polymerase sigma factor (sigma-70 family)
VVNANDRPVDPNDPDVQRLVRDKIRRVVARYRLPSCDREDFGQDLWARVWPRLAAFLPGRAPLEAFVTLIVRRCAIDLLGPYWRRQHQRRGTVSLNRTTRRGTDEVELAQTIGQREYDARRGRHPRANQDLVELTLDLEVLLDQLPEDLRVLAGELMDCSLTEAARRTGRARSTVQHQVQRLRRIAERKGLRDFLKK